MIDIKSKISDFSTLVEGIRLEKIKYSSSLDMHQFCAYWGAYDVFSYIKDMITLVHGPTGCLGNKRFLPGMGYGYKLDLRAHLSTAFNDKDIILGGENKLIDAIQNIDIKYNPTRIMVLTNCCADIIGDDVEGCINSLPKDLRKKVSYLSTGGYSGKSYRKGTEAAFKKMVELINDDPPETVPDSVNLFLRRWIWDSSVKDGAIVEIKRILELVGVKVNKIFDAGISLNEINDMKNGSANVSLCYFWGRSFFKEMYKKFNIPFVKSSYPLGLDPTKTWLKNILTALGKKCDFSGIDEFNKVEEERENLKQVLGKNRDCVIWTQTGERMIAMTKLAQELEMNPIVVGLDNAIFKDKFCIMEREAKSGFNPRVFVSKYIEDVNELLKTLNDPVIFCNENYYPDYPVLQYVFPNNQIYGLTGTSLVYDTLLKTVTRKRSRYSFSLQEM